jgi:sulfatase modifying factor 1
MTTRSGRFHPANLLAIWLMVASAWQVLAVDPVVSNVQAKQREGSRLVDITYDVADPDSTTLTVYLKVSSDGGKTWKGPVERVSGDVGQHIVPGTAKKLVWDAGKEMGPNQYWSKVRYKIGADDWIVPTGMTRVPSGPFQMGDERVVGGKPVRSVIIGDFAIDKTEVTIELWNEVTAWASKNGYDLSAGSSFGVNHPVHSINWYDAVKWNNARSERSGIKPAYYEDSGFGKVYRSGNVVPKGIMWNSGYRLPTEAEWEKAARGGINGKLYPWGTDLLNQNQYTCCGTTTSVASYESNGFGLYDMGGNVSEWCWDWRVDYDIESTIDPRGGESGVLRVIRGGGGSYHAVHCMVAYRGGELPDARNSRIFDYHGFRSVFPSGQP